MIEVSVCQAVLETFMEMLVDLEDGEEDVNSFFKIPFYASDLGENTAP